MKLVRCKLLGRTYNDKTKIIFGLSYPPLRSPVVLLTSVSSAAACPLREYRTSPEQSSQVNGYALLGSCFDIAWNSPGSEPLRKGSLLPRLGFEPLNHSERERPGNRIYLGWVFRLLTHEDFMGSYSATDSQVSR